MRAASIVWEGRVTAAIETRSGYVPIRTVNERLGTAWRLSLEAILRSGQWERLRAWHRDSGEKKLASRQSDSS
ncbi:hypothetical protein [Cohnella thermotolerans]|uniref:hypothetical protein n=1 Tax=Cohnella thermotolerans TaxID=329858 RepID=UPI0003F82E7F|nr:hypothetical protein [Cohnella thermotolerans]